MKRNDTALPQGSEKVRAVRTMFDTIAPRYERVNRLISFGLDARWRNVALQTAKFARRSTVLDLATGTGDFCRLLQDDGHFPVGVDLSFGMLAAAQTSAPLLQGDALNLPVPNASVDGITCGFALRNFVDLEAFFLELARVCRPGARIVLLDAAQPTNRFARIGHSFWFGNVVPRIGGLFSDVDAYRYLPKSLAYLPSPDVLLSSLEGAGFVDAERRTFTMGSAQLISATRSL